MIKHILISTLLMSSTFIMAQNTTDPVSAPVVIDQTKLEIFLPDNQKEELKQKYLSKTKDDFELGVKYLRMALAPFIKKMDREIVTYNYRKIGDVGFKEGDQKDIDTPVAIAYARKWAGSSKEHLPQETGVFGWGFYTAAGLSASSMYGDDGTKNFALVTLKYPKNAIMLDLRHNEDSGILPLSKETIQFFKKICPNLDDSYMSKKRFIKDPLCHRIYLKTMESFNISGVIYNYIASPSSYCDTDPAATAAFMSYNLPIEDQSIDFFTNLDDSAKAAARLIQNEPDPKKRSELIDKFPLGKKTFLEYERMASRVDGSKGSAFQESYSDFKSRDPKTIEAHQAKAKEETLGCNKSNLLDEPTYNPEKVWDVVLEDGYQMLDLGKTLNQALETCAEERY